MARLRTRRPSDTPVIDLRSDTITQPTETMLRAMRHATLADDGRDGDATVQRLEAHAAELTCKEAALLVASGTMGNLLALLTHGEGGGELLCNAQCHTLHHEMGGVSILARLYPRGLPGERGQVDLEMLRSHLRARHTPRNLRIALVWVENTHGASGGAVLPVEHIASVHALSCAQGVAVHMDGARLFNAATALGVPASTITQHVDSVAFCLSKGLSAPMGSLLCGTRAFIERARGFRRMVGGNLRQAGIIAAAGLVALEKGLPRLAEDHATARRLACGLNAIAAQIIDPAAVDTNIVHASVAASGRPAAVWSAELGRRGVRVNAAGSQGLRFVTHRHIDSAAIDAVVAAFSQTWRELAP